MRSIEERNLWFDNDNKIPEYVIYYLEKFGIEVCDNGLMMGSRNNHQALFKLAGEPMVLKSENSGKFHGYRRIIRPVDLSNPRTVIISDVDKGAASSSSVGEWVINTSHLTFSTDCYNDTWWTIQAIELEKGLMLHLIGSSGVSTIVGIDGDKFGNIQSYISVEDTTRGKSTRSRFLLVGELPAITESFEKYTDGIVSNIVDWLIHNIDEGRYASREEIDWILNMINDPRISEVLVSLINTMPRTKEEACENVAKEQGISMEEAIRQYDFMMERNKGLIENGYAERAVIDLSKHVKGKK